MRLVLRRKGGRRQLAPPSCIVQAKRPPPPGAGQRRPFTYKPNNVCNASTANRPGAACPPHFSRVRTEINQNTLSFYQLFLRLSIELFSQCSAKRLPISKNKRSGPKRGSGHDETRILFRPAADRILMQAVYQNRPQNAIDPHKKTAAARSWAAAVLC